MEALIPAPKHGGCPAKHTRREISKGYVTQFAVAVQLETATPGARSIIISGCRLQVNRRLAHFEVRFLQLKQRFGVFAAPAGRMCRALTSDTTGRFLGFIGKL
jgi:hypothetical protein